MITKVLGWCLIAFAVLFLVVCINYDRRLRELREENDVLIQATANIVEEIAKLKSDIADVKRKVK